MKKFIEEFKSFILRGNVIELAVGLLMGTAFTAVVTAVSINIIQPIINALGGGNEEGWPLVIFGISFGIGDLITAIINFLITALVAFFIVQGYNKLQRLLIKPVVVEEDKGPTTEELLAEILTELKK